MAPDARASILLGAGALAGLAVALLGLLGGSTPQQIAEDDVVAVVNGTSIARVDFERALEALETDRRSGEAPRDRARVLDRLIDEELLLQHALGLGLARNDPRVRGQLVRSVIDAVVAEAEAEAASEATLRRFYDEHRDFFTRPGRRRVRRYFVRGTEPAARTRAEKIRAVIEAGGDAAGLGDPIVPVPDALLPVAKLGQYLGPTLAEAASRISVGAVGVPIAAAGGLHVLHVVAAEESKVPSFSSIRDVVASEQRRRAGEEALRGYLDRLRDDAVIARADIE